jgi:hypothetical protein
MTKSRGTTSIQRHGNTTPAPPCLANAGGSRPSRRCGSSEIVRLPIRAGMKKLIQDVRDNVDAIQEDLRTISEFLGRAVTELDQVEAQLAKLAEGQDPVPVGGPHRLDEDFTNTHPASFVLGGVSFDGIRHWQEVYVALCRHLSDVRPETFDHLADDPQLVSRRGTKYFARSGSDFWRPRDLGYGMFAETGLSANEICNRIKRLLPLFGLAERDFVVYLRSVTPRPQACPGAPSPQ